VLALPLYMFHQFEEYGRDSFGVSYAFRGQIASVLGYATATCCPIPMSFLTAFSNDLSRRRAHAIGLPIATRYFDHADHSPAQVDWTASVSRSTARAEGRTPTRRLKCSARVAAADLSLVPAVASVPPDIFPSNFGFPGFKVALVRPLFSPVYAAAASIAKDRAARFFVVYLC
jgi:hypothetical protein